VGVKARVQDHPGIVTLAIVALVGAHAAVGVWFPEATLVPALEKTSPELVVTLYVGVSAVATIVAGFAGVVVVLAMTPGVGRLRALRVLGRDRLEVNWVSPVATSFAAAFLALPAGTAEAVDATTVGVFGFELTYLMSAHGALRLLWLLQALVSAVGAQDREDLEGPAPLQGTIRSREDPHA
jgi:hypothetical protein